MGDTCFSQDLPYLLKIYAVTQIIHECVTALIHLIVQCPVYLN